ncbi:hypothetical protein PMZ80_007814 [Knufia obscura]|uniref:Beta-lactamase-related domain-containing protein n=1 Tax=Knufia obscura TaxID=1635080 RepID=A0ABR0RIG2_9EURO|nr:hypothetical protein PMZ80_007814 [Knufia obscura]
MKFTRAIYLLAVVLTGNAGAASLSSGPCPPAGPDFPAPKSPSDTAALKKAITAFQQTVESSLKNGSISIPLDAEGTTFSFEAWSIHEDSPIHTYHYDATGLSDPAEGVKNVASDTTYRIGSLSKLLTVYTWLATAGDKHWNQPITNFIPELEAYDAREEPDTNDIDHFRWSTITVGALASQLSGIQKDPALPNAVSSLYTPIPGLPPSEDLPQNAQGLQCDTYAKLPCTRESYLNSILVSHPVYATYTEPVYSDMAYSLLALALENITGTPFPTLFQDNVVQALNLTSTSYEAPANHSTSIIPLNDTFAEFTPTLGYLQPGGGYYSSLNDLSAIGRSILSSTLLTPQLRRQWMKPAQFLADGVSAVGAPWEIYQALWTNKTTWMYTKSGDLGKYSGFLILLPDYDAGITILAAGAQASAVSRVLADVGATAFVPAFEVAAKTEASQKLAGEYIGTFANETGTGNDTFEIVLEVDDGPGVSMVNYTVNGVDMREAFAQLQKVERNDLRMRLFPTGLTSFTTRGTQQQGFRMVRYRPVTTDEAPEGAVFSSMRCQEWFTFGGYTSRTSFGVNGGLDEFDFVVGEGGKGKVDGLVVKTWNRVLEKVK